MIARLLALDLYNNVGREALAASSNAPAAVLPIPSQPTGIFAAPLADAGGSDAAAVKVEQATVAVPAAVAQSRWTSIEEEEEKEQAAKQVPISQWLLQEQEEERRLQREEQARVEAAAAVAAAAEAAALAAAEEERLKERGIFSDDEEDEQQGGGAPSGRAGAHYVSKGGPLDGS